MPTSPSEGQQCSPGRSVESMPLIACHLGRSPSRPTSLPPLTGQAQPLPHTARTSRGPGGSDPLCGGQRAQSRAPGPADTAPSSQDRTKGSELRADASAGFGGRLKGRGGGDRAQAACCLLPASWKAVDGWAGRGLLSQGDPAGFLGSGQTPSTQLPDPQPMGLVVLAAEGLGPPMVGHLGLPRCVSLSPGVG